MNTHTDIPFRSSSQPQSMHAPLDAATGAETTEEVRAESTANPIIARAFGLGMQEAC